MVEADLSELKTEKKPLIYAGVVSLICGGLRTECSVNQRFVRHA